MHCNGSCGALRFGRYLLSGDTRSIGRAFAWLDKALSNHGPGRTLIFGNPLFANIHADPRCLKHLEKIGKSPEQLAAIEFDVRLPE